MAVGFFTKGIKYELPHPKVQERVMLLICTVFSKAWDLLKENPPDGFNLSVADEDTITIELVSIIESRLRITGEVNGFNPLLFGKVTRDSKVVNFDKKKPDKMPDIHFDLKRETMDILSEHDGLFVECKPVDSKHPILSCYCRKGLIRYVEGDYAWAMQNALMVGYANSKYTYLKLRATLNDKGNTKMNTISHYHSVDHSFYRSIHQREFEWFDDNGKACPIEVTHFWLTV